MIRSANTCAAPLPATVVTFEPTPREFFEGDSAPARLMRLREKVEALPLYGVDRMVVLLLPLFAVAVPLFRIVMISLALSALNRLLEEATS